MGISKSQLRDSGTTVALLQKHKRALIRVKLPKGRTGSFRLLFPGAHVSA